MREKLRRLRISAGFTQQQLSAIARISRNHYTQIESGERNPSLEVSLRIKRALNYPYDDIFFNPKRPVSRHNEQKKTP